MGGKPSADDLAQRVAERVREVVVEAETRAAEIVREAEREAARIRERAEADARERIETARRALDELEGRLAANPPVMPSTAAAEDPSQPPPAEEPEVPPPAEEPPGAPEAPIAPPAEPGNGGGEGDEAAARLVAMKMALDGKGREEIDRHLAESFDLGDRSKLLDEVLARAGK